VLGFGFRVPGSGYLISGFGLNQLFYRNMQRFRGGPVFKAHRLLYHSTLGFRVIKKKVSGFGFRAREGPGPKWTTPLAWRGRSGVQVSGVVFHVSGFRASGSGIFFFFFITLMPRVE